MSKHLIFALVALLPASASAETLYQCAGHTLETNLPLRLDLSKSGEEFIADVFIGPAISLQIPQLSRKRLTGTPSGFTYAGSIKDKADSHFEVSISTQKDENAEVKGFDSHFLIYYADANERTGQYAQESYLVCGTRKTGPAKKNRR